MPAFKLNDAVYAPHHEHTHSSERVLCRVRAVNAAKGTIVVQSREDSHTYEVAENECIPIGKFVRGKFFGIPCWKHVPEPEAKPTGNYEEIR